VAASEALNCTDELSGINIYHLNTRLVRNVEAVCRGVNGQSNPTAVAADRPALLDTIGLLRVEKSACQKSLRKRTQ